MKYFEQRGNNEKMFAIFHHVPPSLSHQVLVQVQFVAIAQLGLKKRNQEEEGTIVSSELLTQ